MEEFKRNYKAEWQKEFVHICIANYLSRELEIEKS